jgi:opine dehydrogenase
MVIGPVATGQKSRLADQLSLFSENWEHQMRIAVLGAGSLGLAYSAFLSSRGHHVVIWSRTEKSIQDLVANGGRLRAEGKVNGEFQVFPSVELLAALDESEVVIFALPGNGHESVMRSAAPNIRDNHIIVVTPVVSLSACVLAKYAADYGSKPLICASPTTMLTARRLSGTSVNVLTVRPAADVSSLPETESDQAVSILASLFDANFRVEPSMLASSLSNTGPVVHVPLALLNMTRMERGESWLQYEHFTEHVSNLIIAVDRERIALGHAFGFSFVKVEDRMCQSFGAQPDTLSNVAAQIVKLRNGGPSGPKTAKTRYLTEDVPFGLGFFSFVGKLVGMPTPAIDACIAIANLSFDQDLGSENRLLESISKHVSSKEELLELAAGRWKYRKAGDWPSFGQSP